MKITKVTCKSLIQKKENTSTPSWLTETVIANPMSLYPEYHARRSSWMARFPEMVERVVQDFGAVDILVNNAGICPFRDFFDIDEETWNRTLHVNLSGMFFSSQAAARHMKERGKGVIVNISTVTASRGGDKQVHYAASKGGVNSLTTSMACALREYGIRVNGILCGGVHTDINREQVAQLEQEEHKITDFKGVRRLGIPEDIGKAAVYLASDDSEWVTGSLLAVDGGALSSPV